MQIVSFIFFGLVAVVFFLLYLINKLIRNDKKSNLAANYVLLLSSYLFVWFADWRFCAVLFAITLSTWFFTKKKLYTIGLLFPILALVYFKYTNFFAESFSKIIGYDFTALHLLLPLGISFYSFSAISYIVDVSRKKTEPKSLTHVALYLAFFPKLTSGPIQQSNDFFRQIEKKRDIGWNTFSIGIQIFVFGLFKKIVLADRLSVFVEQVYKTPLAFGSITVFLAAIAYSLQIYFDFSGYSDMAIGVARIIGIQLPRNFNLPYLSHNVTELWKRWHITLSAWLQQYIYISLGGNRKGKIRTYINLILTMLIGGIWHGANWTYIVWGLFHGIALAVHKIWMNCTHSDGKKNTPLGIILSVSVTYLFTVFCWIFFRADSISKAVVIIRRIFSFSPGVEQPYMWLMFGIIVLICASVLAYQKSKNIAASKKTNVSNINGYYPLVDLTSFWGLVFFFVFIGLTLCLAYTGGSPFIYGNY